MICISLSVCKKHKKINLLNFEEFSVHYAQFAISALKQFLRETGISVYISVSNDALFNAFRLCSFTLSFRIVQLGKFIGSAWSVHRSSKSTLKNFLLLNTQKGRPSKAKQQCTNAVRTQKHINKLPKYLKSWQTFKKKQLSQTEYIATSFCWTKLGKMIICLFS